MQVEKTWQVGDSVEIDFADIPNAKVPGEDKPSVPGREEAFVIGVVGKIDTEAYPPIASVVEVHSFHRIWGGSNGARGEVHEVPLSALKEIHYSGWRNIVRETRDKDTVRNVLDELLAPEHP